MLRRSTFAAALLPLAARAQPRRPCIALLVVPSEATFDPRQLQQFKAGLAEKGLEDGKTVSVEYLWADGDPQRLRALARGLADRSDVDVIVTAGEQPVAELAATGTRTPIVLAVIGDPIATGMVRTLARPGGTATGLSMVNSELEGKRLDILRSAVPSIARVMVLRDTRMGRDGFETVERTARELGVALVTAPVRAPEELIPAFDTALARGADALLTMASPFLNFQRERIVALARGHRLPSMFEVDSFARAGGLMSYGPSFADMYRRAGAFVAKILMGANPGDLPVEQPTRFELVVNLRTAHLLGLGLPRSFLARADELIE